MRLLALYFNQEKIFLKLNSKWPSYLFVMSAKKSVQPFVDVAVVIQSWLVERWTTWQDGSHWLHSRHLQIGWASILVHSTKEKRKSVVSMIRLHHQKCWDKTTTLAEEGNETLNSQERSRPQSQWFLSWCCYPRVERQRVVLSHAMEGGGVTILV